MADLLTTIADNRLSLLAYVRDLHGLRFDRTDDAGRLIAQELGYTGRKGGWLYDPQGKAVCQGYASLGKRMSVPVVEAVGWQFRLSAAVMMQIAKVRQAADLAARQQAERDALAASTGADLSGSHAEQRVTMTGTELHALVRRAVR